MNGLTMVFMLASVVGVAIAIWINTKPGKEWLKSL